MKKLLLGSLLAATAFGGQMPLDITPISTSTLQSLNAVFPEGTFSSGGILFRIAPSTAPNYWRASESSDSGFILPVNLTNSTHMYILMNTINAVPWDLVGMLSFQDGTGTEISSYAVMSNVDVRDYTTTTGTNTINGVPPVPSGIPGVITGGTVNWFTAPGRGGVQLDALILTIPQDLQSRVSQIAFSTAGASDVFVAGVSVDTPEPATVALVGGALAALVSLRRRG